MNHSITFFDATKNHRINTKYFDTFDEAYQFMKETFDRVDIDLIKTL